MRNWRIDWFTLAYLTRRGERDERNQQESKHRDEIIETLGKASESSIRRIEILES